MRGGPHAIRGRVRTSMRCEGKEGERKEEREGRES
jgi:hypothetical protein